MKFFKVCCILKKICSSKNYCCSSFKDTGMSRATMVCGTYLFTVCVCMCACVCLCVCIDTCTYTHTNTNIHLYTYVYVCMHGYIYCMYIMYMNVCI